MTHTLAQNNITSLQMEATERMDEMARESREWVLEEDDANNYNNNNRTRRRRITFPSRAEWSGYYQQYGHSHQLFSFELKAATATTLEGQDSSLLSLSGQGTDDVGDYTLAGFFHRGTGRLVWTKQYQLYTGNPDENLGHAVEYRGSAVSGNGLQAGIRGRWYVKTHRYVGNGLFHIWPSNSLSDLQYEEEQDIEVPSYHSINNTALAPSAPFEDDEETPLLVPPQVKGTSDNQHHHNRKSNVFFFAADERAECIVCLDRKVTMGLMPCRHVALCATCANQLTSCPLCRTAIEQRIRASGSAA